jgi:hypothetical protein
MIRPEQVPKKVVRAAEKAWENDTESFRPNAKTIAAALNAWPDARMRTTFLPNDDGVWIVPQHMWSLPLTTEASDEPHP